HAVFGGDPAFALAAQEARHAIFHAGRAQHAGLAEGNQHRALGMAGVAALDADFAHLFGEAATGAGNGHALIRGKGRLGYHSPPATQVQPMIRSMTAYATAERATDGGTLACELRAVNHRFL